MTRFQVQGRAFVGLALSALLIATGPATAQTLSSSGEQELPSFYSANGPDPDRWYHVMEFEEGPMGDIVRGVYDRIEKSDAPRRNPNRLDTVIPYGPGHWTYEWEQEAAEFLARARTAEQAGDSAMAEEAYLAAATGFVIGSSPHIRSDTHAMASLEKARTAYRQAAQYFPGSFRVLEIPYEGKTFEAYLHLPPGDGPFPVVVGSNGTDVVKEDVSPILRRELADRGIALLWLDMPGIGGSGAYDLTPASEVLHAATINYIRSDPAIDPDRIAAAATSFGGHASARLALRTDLPLAGVVSSCGPLHSSFVASPEMYDQLPPLTMDAVRDRVGLPIDSSSAELAERMRGFSLKNNPPEQDGVKSSTPLLILTNHDDPVAPIADLPLLTDRVHSSKTLISHEQGHCPDPLFSVPATVFWLDQLFAEGGG
jgi:esterase FrsA